MTLESGARRERLRALLGAEAVLSEPQECAPFLLDHLGRCRGSALAVVQPRSVAQVAQVLEFCDAERIGVVPHGGNTSYCGGAIPDESGHEIVLSLRRLNSIRNVDPENYSLVAEAGCVLAQVQAAAETAGRFFPLSIGSQGSCQIGGNLSTNAGGVNVLRYGMTRDLVLGLEVVLPGGRVLDGLSTLRKDNTGYDIKSL
ncbi:MAG: FAD-binding oxidoreductase, partial [Gammaproteobacteria bacterium]|nr:FAD-binding oxidoreductase [Gammaproteobacteria bacterium]